MNPHGSRTHASSETMPAELKAIAQAILSARCRFSGRRLMRLNEVPSDEKSVYLAAAELAVVEAARDLVSLRSKSAREASGTTNSAF